MLYCTLPVLASIPTPLANICTVKNSTTQQGITAQQDWLVPHYYSCYAVQYYALSEPVIDGYIKKKNLRHSPQSSTCSHTENLNLKNQISTESGVPNAAKIIKSSG